MTKFYIASSLSNRKMVSQISSHLKNQGWHHTYDWTLNAQPTTIEELRTIGKGEFEAVKASDIVIAVLPGGKGTHIEIGIAMASSIPVIIYSETPKVFELENLSSFYLVEGVTCFTGNQDELLEFVKR
ncbi:nucleoside 2-deoxyribosyltransferase [Chryseomicrobium palamuruense]|uniref:Nucleoside 2-deoxyribosyltransferase n=1 Tax=Chryseomicrobium palamuruense TaxID=682973 RepID=A0ABV8UWY9_9BACL